TSRDTPSGSVGGRIAEAGAPGTVARLIGIRRHLGPGAAGAVAVRQALPQAQIPRLAQQRDRRRGGQGRRRGPDSGATRCARFIAGKPERRWGGGATEKCSDPQTEKTGSAPSLRY